MPWSRNTNWRQGSILANKDFQAVGLTDIPPDANLAIAISHDCDIANDDLISEPAVEFIFARIVDKQDGNYTYGKNLRTLHLEYVQGEKTVFLGLQACEKFVLQKNSLEAVHPDESYRLPKSREIFQSWLAARYRRQALPDSLDRRLSQVFEYIKRTVKNNSSGILSFQLDYDPKDDLLPEETYELWLSIVYIIDKPEYQITTEKIAKELKQKFTQHFKDNKVELRQCKAVSETAFTVRDMRETVQYHLEHLSYRIEPSGPVI